MISSIISRIVVLCLGTLYPAYSSYKAVKTKNVKEYVQWMMYWIVYAIFTCGETVADIFLSWLPFYYELKIVFVLWLLSPATKGSSILYRRFVHPLLVSREQEIDSYIAKASDHGYTTLITLGSKGLNYAANVVVNTAYIGQTKIVEQMKSYSMNDLTGTGSDAGRQQGTRDPLDVVDEDDLDNRLTAERYQREMNDMSTGDRTRNPAKRSASARVAAKNKEADLYPVDETEELAGESTSRRGKSSLSANEVSCNGTVTRSRARRSKNANKNDIDEI